MPAFVRHHIEGLTTLYKNTGIDHIHYSVDRLPAGPVLIAYYRTAARTFGVGMFAVTEYSFPRGSQAVTVVYVTRPHLAAVTPRRFLGPQRRFGSDSV